MDSNTIKKILILFAPSKRIPDSKLVIEYGKEQIDSIITKGYLRDAGTSDIGTRLLKITKLGKQFRRE